MLSCWEMQILLLSSVVLKVVAGGEYVLLKDSKYQAFFHTLEKQYFLDKGEAIQVWAKVTPFPWQDNRLIAGISDPVLLEFNTTCVEEVVAKGVVVRNMTAQIFQFVDGKTNGVSSPQDKKGNATFFIEIFDETENTTPIRAETGIHVGCPPGRIMEASRKLSICSSFKNYTFNKHSHASHSNITLDQNQDEQYNFSVLGCPVEANYYDLFKPTLQLYENGVFLREVTANYVLFELNGRTDYSYSATMAQVRCLREAQNWRKITKDEADPSQSWTRENYKSCFLSDSMQTPNLEQPYEILNKTGLSAIIWQNGGIYIFRATVVDPEYSFCNLTTVFAVHVYGIESTSEGLAPFLVLGTSTLALLSCVVVLFVTSKYA